MKVYKIYKIVEKKPEILGINFDEFMIWIFLSIILLALPTITSAFGLELGLFYYIFSLIVIIALYKVLKKVGKKQYTGFIYSFMSFKFAQPKKITTRYTPKKTKNNNGKNS